jgi:hypothetical protein
VRALKTPIPLYGPTVSSFAGSKTKDTGLSAISEPIDVGVDLRPDCMILRRVAGEILRDWAVPDLEAGRVLAVIDAVRRELTCRCLLPARVCMELSHAWPVVTLLMGCADVLVVEYFDVSGFLLGLGADTAVAAR